MNFLDHLIPVEMFGDDQKIMGSPSEALEGTADEVHTTANDLRPIVHHVESTQS